jgi:hypothetical protein
MRKRMLAAFVSLCLLLTLFPAAALAAGVEDCPGDETCTHEAAIGTTHYDTLAEAVAAASSDGTSTVTLLGPVTLAETLTIERGMTFDGAKNTITATGLSPAIKIETGDEVLLENITLDGAVRALDLLHAAAQVTLQNCELNVSQRGVTCSLDGYSGVNLVLDHTAITHSGVTDVETQVVRGEHMRGISLWNIKNSNVTLKNNSSINGFAYCINVSGTASESGVSDTSGLVVSVEDSTLRGWSGFNVWGSSATYNLIRSTVKGINTSNGASDSFAAVVFNDDIYDQFAEKHAVNNTLNIQDATITNYQSGSCTEELLRIDCGITALNLSGTVRFIDTTGNIHSALYLSSMEDPMTFLAENLHKDGAAIVCTTVGGEELPFAPAYNAWYSWPDGAGGTEGVYCDVNRIFDGSEGTLCNGEFLTLLDDVVLSADTVVNLADMADGAGSFTLNQGEFSFSGGKLLLPAGVSVITDRETDGLFAPAEGCGINKTAGEDGTFVYSSVGGVVARVGTTYYGTLAEAVAEGAGKTVTLLKTVTGQSVISIADGQTVTLDLNGYDIGFAQNQRFEITHGTLNLTGAGTVYEQQPYYAPVMLWGAAASQAEYSVVTVGKDVTLQGWAGLFINQNEGSNYGMKATVNGTLNSVKDTSGDAGHALYVNGSITNQENEPQIVLEGATLNAEAGNGMYLAGYANTVVANSTINSLAEGGTGIEIRAGKLTLNSGTAVNGGSGPIVYVPNGNGSTVNNAALAVSQHTTRLPLEVTIHKGCALNGTAALYEVHTLREMTNDDGTPKFTEEQLAEAAAKIKLTVNGGQFDGQFFSENCTKFVWDGYFTTDPTAYLSDPSQMVALESDDPNYVFMVGKRGETPAEVVPATPDVKPELDKTPTQEEQEALERIVEVLSQTEESATTPSIDESVLSAAAKSEANGNTIAPNDPLVSEALAAGGIPTTGEDETPLPITIVVQPYLDIKIKDIAITGTGEAKTTTLTLDITPMFQKVATTATLNADRPEDNQDIVVKTEDPQQTGANAVLIGQPEKLTITKPVTVTIPLPQGFTSEPVLYVTHELERNGKTYTYVYTGRVAEDVLTFENPHGFSKFTMSAVSPIAAMIGEVGYTSFQDAVNDAGDGEKIVVKAAEDGKVSATMSGSSRTILVENGTGAALDVTVNREKKTLAQEGDSAEFQYTRPSGDTSGGGATYDITVANSQNGSVTVSAKRASKGDTVTIDIKPASGYELGELTVTGKDGTQVALIEKSGAQYAFTMPAAAVEVKAAFVQSSEELPFDDVAGDSWYADAVEYVYRNGMMKGTGETAFSPNVTTTRGMIVTILHRMEGAPAAQGGNAFLDVPAGQYYTDAVAWAAAKGIVGGYGDGNFGPNDPITREQMAAMLYRYASQKGYDVAGRADLSSYTDAQLISGYAQDALAWANDQGLVKGTSATTLTPGGEASRAEVAVILMRFCQNVAE